MIRSPATVEGETFQNAAQYQLCPGRISLGSEAMAVALKTTRPDASVTTNVPDETYTGVFPVLVYLMLRHVGATVPNEWDTVS